MQLKVVFLTNSKINTVTIRAIENFNNKFENDKIDYSYISDIEIKNNTSYSFLNQIVSIYNKYNKEYNYFVIINENTTILNFEEYFNLLKANEFKKYIFGFRISNIKGLTFKYSPRVPYIDDSVIFINIDKAKELDYFNRKLINGCHFFKYAKNQALLQSLIEYSLKKDEFFNYFDEEFLFDEYGKNNNNFFPFPFSVCKKSTISNADISYSKKFYDLLIKSQKKNSFIFLEENTFGLFFLNIIKKINSLIRKIENKEFKKSFNEK